MRLPPAPPPLLILAFALALLPASAGRAEIAVGPTVEWLAHAADLIAVATPERVEDVKGPGEVWFSKVRYRLTRVVKGPAEAGDTITIYDFSYKVSDPFGLADAKAKGRAALIFAAIAKDHFPEIDGKYVVARFEHCHALFFLDAPVAEVYTSDFELVATAADVLGRAGKQVAAERQFLKQFPSGRVFLEDREVPFGSPAFRRLNHGSTVYIRLPAYRKEGEAPPPSIWPQLQSKR